MSITREQVADLREGDVVELRYDAYPGTVIRGPVHGSQTGALSVLFLVVRDADGAPVLGDELTVVSRAPRPLYVNHPRTKPADGDIVRDRDGDAWRRSIGRWFMAGGSRGVDSIDDCKPLTLLWDAERKQVVQ